MPQPHHRLPSMSTRNPSGVPGPASRNILLAPSMLPLTSNTRSLRVGMPRDSTTYSFDFIRRERQPVGTLHIVGHHGDRAGLAIDAIHVGGQLRFVLLALVIAEQAERADR